MVIAFLNFCLLVNLNLILKSRSWFLHLSLSGNYIGLITFLIFCKVHDNFLWRIHRSHTGTLWQTFTVLVFWEVFLAKNEEGSESGLIFAWSKQLSLLKCHPGPWIVRTPKLACVTHMWWLPLFSLKIRKSKSLLLFTPSCSIDFEPSFLRGELTLSAEKKVLILPYWGKASKKTGFVTSGSKSSRV